MRTIYLVNEGLIDLRAIKTFGVSVKETNNPIGYFGTGLKYAIAILLRNGHSINLYRGGERFEFKTKPTDIRGKNFELITMNGEELPFTTELGKTWEMWQAFRELYCNCIDEGGKAFESRILPSIGLEDKTVFEVIGNDFADIFENREEIILSASEKLRLERIDSEYQVFDENSYSFFYRGVRVRELEKPSLFTYNIRSSVQLTEDRTLVWPHIVYEAMGKAIAGLVNESKIRRALLCGKDFLEHQADFSFLSYSEICSSEFLKVLKEEFERNSDKLNISARRAYAKIHDQESLKHYEPYEMTEVEEKQLSRALFMAEKVFSDITDFKILVVKTLGENTLAMADLVDNKIIISRGCFRLGTKYLTSTLLEEYAHLKTGYTDHTRELQTWLFDTICCLIENHIAKEPI